MFPGQEIVRQIQRDYNQRGVTFLATIHRTNGEMFRHYPYQNTTQAMPLDHQPHGHDLYFTPRTFRNERRVKESALSTRLLYADVDHTHSLPVQPTYYWLTSKSSTQAIWVMKHPVDERRWEALNRAMTQICGADPGGWSSTKLLRVPGSINWKRKDLDGKILSMDTSVVYEPAYLEDKLQPAVASGWGEAELPMPPLPDEEQVHNLYRAVYPKLTLRARSMLNETQVSDRSWHIVRTAKVLGSDCGLNPKEIFTLLWYRPWNKWRDRPEMLWTICQD